MQYLVTQCGNKKSKAIYSVWNVVFVYWCICVFVYWCICVLVYLCIGVLVYLCLCKDVFVFVYWCICVFVLVYLYTWWKAICRVCSAGVECCSSRGVLAQVSSGVMSPSDSSSCLATPTSQLKFSAPYKTLTHKSTEVGPGHLNSLELT